MVPLRDENPTYTTPYITYVLILLNVLAFFYEASLGQSQLESFFNTWALVPKEFTASLQGNSNFSLPEEITTLFSSQFLHAGILHLGGNMLYLWIFGNNVEDQMGHTRFLVFYLLCGMLAALAQWFFSTQSGIPSLGASGAIAGVMGAYILRFPRARILALIPIVIIFFTVRIPAYVFLGIWFVQQAFYGVASLDAPTNVGMESGGVAYWAHAGGFVFGAVLGPIFGLFSNSGAKASPDGNVREKVSSRGRY